MPLDNWRFFAISYLNDWCQYDHGFVHGLLPGNDKTVRLNTLQRAAAYYRVARNFPTREEERLAGALGALDAVGNTIPEEALDSTVCNLAGAFELAYGQNAISAASKFLWLRFKSPVVIYDGRAAGWLRAHGGRFNACDYGTYRKEWRRQYNQREATIRSICEELVGVHQFSLAHLMTAEKLVELTASGWFQERVFDKFLWWNGAD